ncbi:dihydrofolate reductase [Chitinophaga sp. SYP-B3965]|uniref:dihydrofolate reductase family protein n=1 Tax=Chitinophaga sp. SYP-B3965 TaxID=2663120 RepID=UPI00129956D2|nr:dihydrofolate reductase family protein [Chitinophaga sp. SYP-B3965]MRG48420.1 dihydrofolate reductase [Chitinophaga sp. SYP-B3965]
MKKVVLNLAVSLDGLIEGPKGELDWLVRDEEVEYADILQEILADKDIIFYGRVSYEKWGNVQPDENADAKLQGAYKLLHSKKKYVFSRTMKHDDTNAVFINSNIKETVLDIKQQPGKDIWLYGGSDLTTTFLNLDLIDVFRLAVHPVILGQGKPLFKDIKERHKLKLLDVKGYKSGIILETYEKVLR